MTEESQFPEAELARLADGSLPADRKAQLRAEVARDPAMAKALAEQERAIALVRGADPPAPDSLGEWLDSQVKALRPARRLPRLRLAFTMPAVAAVAAAAAVIAVLVGGGGGGAPTLAQTTHLALSAAVYPAPSVSAANPSVLTDTAAGIRYPSWMDVAWTPTGARVDSLAGRTIMTVFYTGQKGYRVGYSIVSGAPLAVRGGVSQTHAGVRFTFLRFGSARMITWRRANHTCVIAGRDVSDWTLLRLATA